MVQIKNNKDFDALIDKALKKSAKANVRPSWWCSRNIFQNVVAGLIVAALLGGGAFLIGMSRQKGDVKRNINQEETVRDEAKQTQALL